MNPVNATAEEPAQEPVVDGALERHGRRLRVEGGRFTFLAADKRLGWQRMGFQLGLRHGNSSAGFSYDEQGSVAHFAQESVRRLDDGFEMTGAYPVPGLVERIRLQVLDNGALRIERRIRNEAGISHLVSSAGLTGGDGGGPVFTDNHIWRARYCHVDNVRAERYPWCRPEYPYVRCLPKEATLLGGQENQALPALLLTNDRYSELLVEGQLAQDRTRAEWTLAAGSNAPIQCHHLAWSMYSGGVDLGPGAELVLEPIYYEILEQRHPQDCWLGYLAAVTGEQRLQGDDNVLLHRAFYCSWNYGVFQDIDEQSLVERARLVAERFPAIKHFLIDGGWQSPDVVQCPSCANFYLDEADWHHRERFPNGMKAVADGIRAAGLSPAIWWTPAVGLHSRLAKDHPEWLAKDASGNAYRIGNSGYLDYSLAPVQQYIHMMLDVMCKRWGFEAIKMDFWSQSVESNRIRFATGNGVQWRDWLLSTIRSYLPEDGFIMTCVAVAMGNPFLGKYAQTYRCSIDVGVGDWDHHVISSIWNLPLHGLSGRSTCLPNVDGIGWNDAISVAENRHRLTYAFITMGSLEVDGHLERLTDEQVRDLNVVLAHVDRGHRVRCPDERAFVGKPLPDCLIVDYPADSRTAARGVRQHIAYFNWGDTPGFVGYDAEQLGLSEQAAIRDMWEDVPVHVADGSLVRRLPPRSALLLEVR